MTVVMVGMYLREERGYKSYRGRSSRGNSACREERERGRRGRGDSRRIGHTVRREGVGNKRNTVHNEEQEGDTIEGIRYTVMRGRCSRRD